MLWGSIRCTATFGNGAVIGSMTYDTALGVDPEGPSDGLASCAPWR